MVKSAKVLSLDIQVKNGKKVHLSMAEAKELHAQLDELFGKKHITNISYPYRYPYVWYNSYGTVAPQDHISITSIGNTLSNDTGMSVAYNATA